MMTDESYSDDVLKIGQPDARRLSELIKRAKGVNRTMAEYAKDCNATAVKCSRIATGKTIEHLSIDLLRQLYLNQDIDSGISWNDWITANGMKCKETAENAGDDTNIIRTGYIRKARPSFERVFSSLVDRGVLFRTEKNDIINFPFNENYRDSYQDAASRVVSLVDGGKIWRFVNSEAILLESQNYSNGKFTYETIYQHLIFLQDAWFPETFRNVKNSFLFSDRSAMEKFIHFYKNGKFINEFSVILVTSNDESGMDEIKEYKMNGEEYPESVFLKEKIYE